MNRNFVLIFVIALTIRIWFNFFDIHPNAAFAFDASEYLRDAQNLNLVSDKVIFLQPNYLWLSAKALIGLASINEFNQVKAIFAPLREMSISGPVFPIFLLSCYKIFGQSPSAEIWMIPVGMQCLFSALTCVLIAAIGNTCWDKRTGLVAGLLSACYPGFIVNSGRLYSESLGCFLVCLVIWLVSNYWIGNRRDYKRGILLGASLFALQVTRSIMSGLSIAIFVLFVASSLLVISRRKLIGKYLLFMIVGFFLCLLPWLFLQKLAYGKTSFIVDRRSNYNLYIGNDVDGLGWLRIPYPDCRGIDEANPWSILNQSISKSPDRWLKLMLDKPVRLLKLPWNDFKASIGMILPDWQATFHQLVLAFAVVGLAISTLVSGQEFKRPRTIARLIILFTLLLHSVYLLFDAVPRYALTAMPELILFAGAGIAAVLCFLETRRYIFTAIGILAAIALLILVSKVNILQLNMPFNGSDVFVPTMPFSLSPSMLVKFNLLISILLKLIVCGSFFIACAQLVVSWCQFNKSVSGKACALLGILLLSIFTLPAYSLPLRAHGRWYEWSYELRNSGQIKQSMLIDKAAADQLMHAGAYLAVNLQDGSDLSTNSDISVNGLKMEGPFIPALAIAQNLSLIKLGQGGQLMAEQEFILKCLCDMSAENPLDLRQWYLIPVKGDQWKKIIGMQNVFVRGRTDDIVLSIAWRKFVDSPSTIYGAYRFDPRFSMMPSIFRFSWEKIFYGAENPSGLADPSYDDRIERSKLSIADDLSGTSAYIRLLLPDQDALGNKVSQKDLSATEPLSLIDEQKKEVNFFNESSLLFKPKARIISGSKKDGYWLIRLIGKLEQSKTSELIQSVHVLFSAANDKIKGKADLSYSPLWQPVRIKLANGISSQSEVKFDYCFPLMLSAFPGHIEAIQIHLAKNKNGELLKQDRDGKLKCCLKIYQVNKPISGASREIF